MPQPLLLLEYIKGPSLRQLISSDPAGMTFGQVLKFALQIAEGLAYSHTCPMPGGKTGRGWKSLRRTDNGIPRSSERMTSSR